MTNEELVREIQSGKTEKMSELWEQVRRYVWQQTRRPMWKNKRHCMS